MSIINKIKTTAKCLINQIPLADLRSILAPRGVLIFENERESHLHTLSLLHGALRRDFFADDVTRWREDFGHRGEAIRYLSNTNSSRSWSFDVYSAASVTLLRDLYVPGEEPPPVQLPELDDSVKSWNAQHGTEFVLIDESELSELQDQALLAAARWRHLDEVGVVLDHRESEVRDLKQTIQEMESDIESITNDATEDEGEIRDLKQTIQEMEDRAQELQGELDRWHSLGSAYGINYDVSDVERKLELLNERTERLNEWESLGSGYGLNLDVSDVEEKLEILEEWEELMSRGLQPSDIEAMLEDACDWIELGDDTGLTPCEIEIELDRLQEVDADLTEAKNQLGSAGSKAYEIGLRINWLVCQIKALQTDLDC